MIRIRKITVFISKSNQSGTNLELDERFQHDKQWHSDGDNEVKKLPQRSATWRQIFTPVISPIITANAYTYIQLPLFNRPVFWRSLNVRPGSPKASHTRTCGCETFYRPDANPVTQQTLSEY